MIDEVAGFREGLHHGDPMKNAEWFVFSTEAVSNEEDCRARWWPHHICSSHDLGDFSLLSSLFPAEYPRESWEPNREDA